MSTSTLYTGSGLSNPARDLVASLINVPIHLRDKIKHSIATTMSKGSEVIDVRITGAARWTTTALVKTIQQDGLPRDFFVKVAHTKEGREMLNSEYESMKAIWAVIPDNSPQPLEIGVVNSDPSLSFLRMEFIQMSPNHAEIEPLAKIVADMHKRSISPNERFGFHIPTYAGAIKQPNTWCVSWEAFFSDLFARLLEFEQQIHGEHEEMRRLSVIVIENMIPRLLRPLETGGNQIKPSLVHADLWDGNTSTNAETGKPVIFDAFSHYGHHEYEYLKYVNKSEPKEDFEDRLLLYKLRFVLTSSASYLEAMHHNREIAIADTRYLANKFPDGYRGPYGQKSTAEGEELCKVMK